MARSLPNLFNTKACCTRRFLSNTPITCLLAPAGLLKGPTILNNVLTPNAFLTGAANLIALWCAGANIKPIPTDSIHPATSSGSKSIRAPRASSTSALPEELVTERPPCFATRPPAAATTKAEAVEILNVFLPSPPVPQVSMR